MKCQLVVALLAILGVCCAQTFNVSSVLDSILQGYDKRVRPNWGRYPVEVGVTMYFIRIFDISTKDQSLKTDFYFRQTWTDQRLAFEAPPGINYVTVGAEAAKSFWEPDTFFADAHTKMAHDANTFFKIHRDGSILKSVRIFSKSHINMDLHNFPKDENTFSLSLESYGYSSKDIIYKWDKEKKSVGLSNEVGSHEIYVTGYKLKTSMVSLSTGNYSGLEVTLGMIRRSGYYVRHLYMPAIFVFVFTWISFWFSPALTTVRVLLLLVCFATGNFLLSQLWNCLPPVDYITMLEKYIVFGLIMTVVALVECALVVFLERRARGPTVYESDLETNHLEKDNKDPSKKQQDEGEQTNKGPGSYILRSTRYIMTIHQHRRGHQKVDIFFRLIYPIIYIIYNIAYFMSFP